MMTLSSKLTMFKEPTVGEPVSLLAGDTRKIMRTIPDNTFDCVVTSPPYWGVRDYGHSKQIGAEPDLEDYVKDLVAVFREVRRTLKPDGTFWLNIANTYSSGNRTWRDADSKNKGRAMSYRPQTPKGLKPKDLIGVAWMVALGCQLDGWYLRNDIIWHKPNNQPESVKDRVTQCHEYLFLMTKSERYNFAHESIKVPTVDGTKKKSPRSVWDINTEPYAGAHFAVFPRNLVRPCLLAGAKKGGLVLDPFAGSGTVCEVALEMGLRSVGIEAKEEYIKLARQRISRVQKSLDLG